MLRHGIQLKNGDVIKISVPIGTLSAPRQLTPLPNFDGSRTTPRTRLVPNGPQRLPEMPHMPKGGHGIALTGDLQVICRYAPEPPPGTLPATTFTRRFDPQSYVLPLERPQSEIESSAVPGTKVEMIAELRQALMREDSMQRVIDFFRKFDLNANGLVCRDEFRRALPLLGLRGYAYSDMDLLFSAIDTDSSDQIEYAELYRLLRKGSDVEMDERLKAGAVSFDVREKGASTACRASARDSRVAQPRVGEIPARSFGTTPLHVK
jgi:Ca2+-binding EF-hand superfamily protein